jgi:hypothetical protein
MSETNNNLTTDDLDRVERYLRDARRRLAMGEAIQREDFMTWCRQFAAWVLDKIEDAWAWIRKQLGLD